MKPTPSLLILVLFGTNGAWAARKSIDARRLASRRAVSHQNVHGSDALSAKNITDRTQVRVNDFKNMPSPVESETHIVSVLPSRRLSMTSLSALLEHSALLMSVGQATSFNFGRQLTLLQVSYVCIFTSLLIVSIMVFCFLLESRGIASGKDADFFDADEGEDNEELIKRLSQTLSICHVGTSRLSRGTNMEKRHIGMWWEKDAHTLASTKLGWWESEQQYSKRGRALDGFLLREISEVKQTETGVETDGELGVCILYESEKLGRTCNLICFFETEQLANQYAEDLKVMTRRVKADAGISCGSSLDGKRHVRF